MVICNRLGSGCSSTLDTKVVNSSCPDVYGCPSDICPDFVIKRHDTLPPFKVSVEDCDGPLNLEGESIILEVNMWALAKLKAAITDTATSFRFADDIGFYQVTVGDIIVADHVRSPEHMLVTGFDETNKLVVVERGYNGTTAMAWAKGDSLRIFRILNAPATIEMITQDEQQVDGTVNHDVLTDTFLVYEWGLEDTCLPGCYWLEFKVLKESITDPLIPSVIPSNICSQEGIEWVRRFPVQGEGFLIKIIDSATKEF